MTLARLRLPRRREALLVSLSLLVALLGAGRSGAAGPAAVPAPAAKPAPPPGAPAADAGGETFYESVDVDVVNVEVVATDRSGHPVPGLTREDFELLEDGKPAAISNFFSSWAQAGAAAAAAPPKAAPGAGAASSAPPAPPADQALNFAVFVDNENLTANARRPALGAVQDFLHRHVGAGDRVILAAYDGNIQVTQHSGADTAALDAAMKRLMMTVTRGGLASENRFRLERAQEALEEGGGRDAAADFGALDEDNQVAADLDAVGGRRALSALTSFITSLAGLPGRKALVVVTGAFAQQSDPLLARIAEHANSNRVTVYVLGALDTPVSAQFEFTQALGNNAQAPTDALTGALHTVADRTGGLIATDLNDPGSFLERVHADVGSYYSLGFVPEHKRDGKVHRLAVKVRGRGGLNLRYRETYEDRSGDQRAAAETVSSLLLGMGENPLGVELSFEPAVAAAHGGQTLPVVVHVPLAKLVLVPKERFHEGRLTLFVGTRDGRGRLSTLKRLTAPVHVANDKLLSALGQSVGYRVEVPVRAGEQVVAVGVRDEIGHVDSTASVPLRPERPAGAGGPSGRKPGR